MELFFRIKKSPNIIFDYLTDMQKFASVHPVISKIEETPDGHFLVHETLKLGIIPYSFTYLATVEGEANDNIIIMRATVMKLTKIEMTFTLKHDNDGTSIEENIKIKSPLPVRLLMDRVFRKNHTKLFKNIENVS